MMMMTWECNLNEKSQVQDNTSKVNEVATMSNAFFWVLCCKKPHRILRPYGKRHERMSSPHHTKIKKIPPMRKYHVKARQAFFPICIDHICHLLY